MNNWIIDPLLSAALWTGAAILYRVLAFEFPLTAFLGKAIYEIAKKHPNIAKPLGLCEFCNTMWIATISSIFECFLYFGNVQEAAPYFIAKILITSFFIKLCR